MKTKIQELMTTGLGDIIEELSDMNDAALARTKGGLSVVEELVETIAAGRASDGVLKAPTCDGKRSQLWS